MQSFDVGSAISEHWGFESIDIARTDIFVHSFIHSFIHSNFKQVKSIKQSGIETIIVNQQLHTGTFKPTVKQNAILFTSQK